MECLCISEVIFIYQYIKDTSYYWRYKYHIIRTLNFLNIKKFKDKQQNTLQKICSVVHQKKVG